MPPIACEKQVFDDLCRRVGPAVVVICRYRGDTFVDFGTGFVIVSDHSQVLVCVHKSIVKKGENLDVRFKDGAQENATLFAENKQSNHVILKTSPRPRSHRHCVQFTEYPIRRQNMFTMAAVEAGERIGLTSGTVSIPDCTAVRPNGTIVLGSEILFAMSCPLSGPKVPEDKDGRRLVGAAVFTIEGLVIGTIDHVDSGSSDIKYARKTTSFLNSLEDLLKKIDNTVSLSKGEQRGVTTGAGTSRRGGTTTGSGNKRRSRDPPCTGGTSIKRGLCMDHLKLNVVVASEESSRLRMFPFQGDMAVGRREAKRRELVRLVTRESDGRRRGSSCSPDLCLEMTSRGQECMKQNIDIPFMVSHLDDAPHNASVLLENQATSAQPVVIASGLSQAGVKLEKPQKNQQNEFNSCHLQPYSNAPSKLL